MRLFRRAGDETGGLPAIGVIPENRLVDDVFPLVAITSSPGNAISVHLASPKLPSFLRPTWAKNAPSLPSCT